MKKNTAGQSVELFAFDTGTNLPATGEAANITAYVSINHAAPAALADTSAVEVSNTTAKGVYRWSVSQAETNGDRLLFTGVCSTSGIEVIGKEFVTDQQDAILAAIGETAIVRSPVIKSGLLQLVEGDTYDGTLNPKIYWTTTTDYTGANSITLTIWRVEEDETRTTMKTAAGDAPTSTRVEIPDMTATFLDTLVFKGKPMQETLQFAVVAVVGTDEYTVAKGDCVVLERRD